MYTCIHIKVIATINESVKMKILSLVAVLHLLIKHNLEKQNKNKNLYPLESIGGTVEIYIVSFLPFGNFANLIPSAIKSETLS